MPQGVHAGSRGPLAGAPLPRSLAMPIPPVRIRVITGAAPGSAISTINAFPAVPFAKTSSSRACLNTPCAARRLVLHTSPSNASARWPNSRGTHAPPHRVGSDSPAPPGAPLQPSRAPLRRESPRDALSGIHIVGSLPECGSCAGHGKSVPPGTSIGFSSRSTCTLSLDRHAG